MTPVEGSGHWPNAGAAFRAAPALVFTPTQVSSWLPAGSDCGDEWSVLDHCQSATFEMVHRSVFEHRTDLNGCFV